MDPSPAGRTSFSSANSNDTNDIQRLLDEEMGECREGSLSSSPEPQSSPREIKCLHIRQYLIHFFLLTIALGVFLSGSINNLSITERNCTRKLSAWSPLVDTNAIRYKWQTWQVSDPAETKYRGPPSVEREAAWDGLWYKELAVDGGISIPSAKMMEMNRTEGLERQMTPSGNYAGFLEVFHQVHCLATLRQYTYQEEYIAVMGKLPATFQKPAAAQRMHLDHCIEVLRLSILCSSDVSITLSNIAPDEPSGYRPDFDGLHKCRDFEAIKEWVDEYTGV